MKLIENAQHWWQFWSIRFAGLQQATILLWVTCVPSDFKSPATYHWFEAIVSFEGALILLARVIKQQPIDADSVKPLPKA